MTPRASSGAAKGKVGEWTAICNTCGFGGKDDAGVETCDDQDVENTIVPVPQNRIANEVWDLGLAAGIVEFMG